MRESRALEAAGRLGLVLEHDLSATRFHYVMPYVPGEDLDTVTRHMHRSAGPEGLTDEQLRRTLGYASDLLATLDRFHRGGLWHKDIKPTNLIVSSDRVHLVDLGLVTPLESAMTLTTHGTEYFRDPELVRLAMKGVKVHEVDGVKFDLYSAGAVLYSMIEGSFPAHGSLSRITRRCPDALQWIVRRAMAEMSGRYGTAAEMLADLRTTLGAKDPFAVRPADLPSVQGRAPEEVLSEPSGSSPFPTESAAATAAFEPAAEAPSSRRWCGWRRSRTRAAHRATPRSSRRASVPPSTGTARVRRRMRRHTMAAGFFALFFGMFVAAAAGVLSDGRPRARHRAVHQIGDLVERVGERVTERARTIAERATNPGRRSGRSTRRAAQVDPVQAQIDVAARLWERRLAPELPAVRELAESLPGVAYDSRAGAPGAPRPAGASTVLVLEDLPPSADPRILEGLRTCLEGRGYRVVGLDHGASAHPGDAPRTIEWAAGARTAVGLSDPTDALALARLESFLSGTDPSLEAVLWLVHDRTEDHLLYHLVRRPEPEAAVPARIVFQGSLR